MRVRGVKLGGGDKLLVASQADRTVMSALAHQGVEFETINEAHRTHQGMDNIIG